MKIEELTIHPLIEAFLKANNDTVENVKEDIKRGYRAEIFADIQIFAENNQPFMELTENQVGLIGSDFLDMITSA